jgi:NAD(P)-dependent dehydrogenase (short-subunit alcohol dehydrogenase family)
MRSLAELMDLRGRRALITGGAGQIAGGIAEALIELGATLTLVDRDVQPCAERAAALPGAPHVIACDLRDELATRHMIREAQSAMGGLDILVHCAAYVGTTQSPGWAVPFDRQTVEAWDAALRVNLTAAFVMAQEAREPLAATGHGSIILLSSIYGVAGPDMSLYEGTQMANPLAYGASKGGVLQLVRYLATILGPRVRVNAVSPGGIEAGQPEIFRERYERRTPLHRMGRVEDIKGAVAFLASDLAAYVTGHNLLVDGGWTAW